MYKYLKFASLVLLFSLLTACSKEEVLPEDRLNSYLEQWQEQNFSQMYDLVADASKETYPAEAFIDRYEKIYSDIEVEDLSITYTVPTLEDEDAVPTSFPIKVSMKTMAGEVTFDSELSLVEQETEEDSNWYVQWDPGYIFPQLKNGEEIAIETIDPVRGQIFDRHQIGLAVNQKIYNVGVQPGLLADTEAEQKEQIAKLLNMDIEQIDQALAAEWVTDDTFVPLKKVSLSDQNFIDTLFAIPAVIKQDTTGRAYPYGASVAHLTGYIGKITAEELEEQESGTYAPTDVIGKRGLEQLYESRLKGVRGVKIVATNENGEKTPIVEKPAENGEDITLTIDAGIQKTIYDNYQGDAGTAAAINPKTGETLALVSSPAFDPNQLSYGISQTNWEKLQNDEQNPLLNRFASTYTPGSSIKPITAAIGLKNETITPNEGITINGLTWSKEGWGNYQVRRVSQSSEPVQLRDALIRSDNIYFAQKTVELGSEAFVSGLEQFGFGQDFPFTYPITASTVSSSGTIDREILLADTGYGQGEMQMSTLHLATAYTPFINNGTLIKPVLEMDEEKGQIWQEGLITSENNAVIKDALRQVVIAPNGTAPEANIADVALAGKTGTAELKNTQNQENAQENGWFVAYKMEEDILISMMVEHVENKGGSHYTVKKVANIFKQIN